MYKLYEATDGHPDEWRALRGLGEPVTTISRAIERGWVTINGAGKLLDCRATLTLEGRRLARKGLREDNAQGVLRLPSRIEATAGVMSPGADCQPAHAP